MRDHRARLGYLDQVTALLYATGAPEAGGTSTVVDATPATSASDARRARAVPADLPPAAADRSPAAPSEVRGSATAVYALVPSRYLPRRLVPRSRRLPWRRLLPQGPGTIESYLSEVFGRHVRATVHVRPARRANRKPVLEIRDGSGTLLAFVKVGDTDRTRALVQHESATLALLADLPMTVVAAPRVLHHGAWNGLDVLALSPLTTRRGRVSPALLERAVHEIATIPRHQEPAQARPDTPAATRPDTPAATRPDASAGTRPDTPADPRADTSAGWRADTSTASWVDTSADSRGDTPAGRRSDVQGGDLGGHAYAWHGDFSPWNIALAPGGRLAVWDWERFATGVPLGLDTLHHFFQRAVRRMPPARAAEACLASSPRLLAPFGPSADEARHTAAEYLISLADRYERDGHQPLGPPAGWLNPVLDHLEVLR
ncbi:hypothetical protein Sme01_14800 [Sphaerisporangium melleum]|uniref:Aminoglycoside phosphotransferase domain-containing protein n=1 Tax=Sphaerisporangium melleum TaxID=321316 RepID=A0A917QUZ3_9ACTN|nr:hypothetical protein [Sphaerisporangium melleum]GGK69323.1 hypothetical protein GCM10007964_10400 [Sphaerisporangium melleum]GII69004.1 hypothetical protein Sme01_14800 [Sphaerisporangium melleum]